MSNNSKRSELTELVGEDPETQAAAPSQEPAPAAPMRSPNRAAVDAINARNAEADRERTMQRESLDAAAKAARERARPSQAESQLSAAEATELAEQISTIRARRRVWASGLQQKLALPKRRGYHRHWFNDVGTRIDDAKASGWAHVKGHDGTPIMRVVGSARSGQPLVAYAMELPEVIWQEDLDRKNAEAEAVLESTRRNPFKSPPGMAQPQDARKFYSPVEEREPLDIRKG